eukprot:6176662-Pleurochrysis_carterae.AAC.2
MAVCAVVYAASLRMSAREHRRFNAVTQTAASTRPASEAERSAAQYTDHARAHRSQWHQPARRICREARRDWMSEGNRSLICRLFAPCSGARRRDPVGADHPQHQQDVGEFVPEEEVEGSKTQGDHLMFAKAKKQTRTQQPSQEQ